MQQTPQLRVAPAHRRAATRPGRARSTIARILSASAVAAHLATAGVAAQAPRKADADPFAGLVPNGKFVWVDLAAGTVRMMDGAETLWSTPAGTGTGLRLRAREGEWDFRTPTGRYEVMMKERDPQWTRPDWYFVERGLPVPAADDPARRSQAADLGVAAVYIGQDLAIHGTDQPELLGRRVSHGCIRIANPFALRLYHNVQVGTPVVITGHPTQPIPTAPATAPRRARPADPLAKLPPDSLAARLAATLRGTTDTWAAVAGHLADRAAAGDSASAAVLLLAPFRAPDPRAAEELATFAADAFSRAPGAVAAALGRLPPGPRGRAAATLVNAVMDLYHGPLARAPWPSLRLADRASSGVHAIEAAELAYRAANPGA